MGQQQANMGVALGDVDGDGLFDLFVTHESHENHTLWRQGPRGLFRDRTGETGLNASRWRGTGFGTVLADFDHDGGLDLALVNGRVFRGKTLGPGPYWDQYAERSQLFLNQGDGRFADVSPANDPFCGTPVVGRGLVRLDFDGDGAIDLLVTAVAGPARLYRNIAPKKGHWLMVRAVDPGLGGRDAYGAEVAVKAGGRRRVGIVQPAGSYLCSSDPRVHFGLGAVERVDGVEITWPDGDREEFPASATDRVLLLRKGDGRKAPRPGVRP
jgi:enediyne biosynthesis protein E4